jgi:hypothetical protein
MRHKRVDYVGRDAFPSINKESIVMSKKNIFLYFSCLLWLSMFAGCDFFSPWSAFNQPDYSALLAPQQAIPDAMTLYIGDSIRYKGFKANQTDWYGFTAHKDSTYVVKLFPGFNAGVVLFKENDLKTLASNSIRSKDTGYIMWTCDSSGTYGLRVWEDFTNAGSSYYSYSYFISLKSFNAVFKLITDIYEPDGKYSPTTLFPQPSSGTTMYQVHRLTAHDTDWFSFTVRPASTYVIETSGGVDTKLYALSPGLDSVIASNDNSGGGNNARLTWTSPLTAGGKTVFYVTGATAQTAGTYAISMIMTGAGK